MKNKIGMTLIVVSIMMLMIPVIVDATRHRNETSVIYDHQAYREDVLYCIDHHYFASSDGLDKPVVCVNERGEEVQYPPNSPYKELQ